MLTEAEIFSTRTLSVRQAAKTLGVGKTSVSKYRKLYASEKPQEPASGPYTPPETLPPKVRVLLLDLETSPNLAHVWGLWDQNISIKQLLASTEVICFGARWLDEGEVEIRSQFRDTRQGMLKRIHELMDEADVIVGWNSKGFDVKHLNREFIEAGMLPPSPTTNMDLMLEVKKHFRFPSNKLDYVAQALGVGKKVQHSGHELWIRCLAGEDAAWVEMYEYQKQDVDLLVDLYYKLQPWIKTHPNVGLFTGEDMVCVNCGSDHLQKRGFYRTTASVFQQYQCQACGKWQHGSKRLSTTGSRSV